jgi:hypothetical protein
MNKKSMLENFQIFLPRQMKRRSQTQHVQVAQHQMAAQVAVKMVAAQVLTCSRGVLQEVNLQGKRRVQVVVHWNL